MHSLAIPPVLQSVSELGRPMDVYKRSSKQHIVSSAGCGITFLFAIVVGYYGFVIYPQSFPGVASANSPYILGFALLILLGGAYWAWRTISGWNDTSVVYGDGFACQRAGKTHAYRWSDVASMTMNVVKMSYYGVIPAGTQETYVIRDQKGNQFKVDGSVPGLKALVKLLRERTYPFIMSRAKQALDAGQAVAFGPLTVSKLDGIRKGKKQIAWNEIGGLKVTNGIVEIKPKRGGLFGNMSAAVAEIANVDVFLAIVDEVLGQAT